MRGTEWFRTEVELSGFLANTGAPVAPPAAGVDPGPHEHGGLLVTFWAYVEHDPDRVDPIAAGRSLRELHAALSCWTRPLPTCDRLEEVRRLLEALEPSDLVTAAELNALRARGGRFRATGPSMATHTSATSSGPARARCGATSKTPARARSSRPRLPLVARPAENARGAGRVRPP